MDGSAHAAIQGQTTLMAFRCLGGTRHLSIRPGGILDPGLKKLFLASEKVCVVHMLTAAKPTTRVFHDLISQKMLMLSGFDVEPLTTWVRDGQTVCLESCVVESPNIFGVWSLCAMVRNEEFLAASEGLRVTHLHGTAGRCTMQRVGHANELLEGTQ